MISMLSCKVSGMVMDVYNRSSKNGDSVAVADLYIGHEIFRIAKVDSSFVRGTLMEDIPVKVYNNQFGLSLVYDDEIAKGV